MDCLVKLRRRRLPNAPCDVTNVGRHRCGTSQLLCRGDFWLEESMIYQFNKFKVVNEAPSWDIFSFENGDMDSSRSTVCLY